MVCWNDGDEKHEREETCYHATAERGDATALFDTGCAITRIGEHALEQMQGSAPGFVLSVDQVGRENAARIRFGAGDAVVADSVATLALKFPAQLDGAGFDLGGTLRAYVVPGSSIPLLLSVESIQAAFDEVELRSGVVRWAHNREVTVQMTKGKGPHWHLPVYCSGASAPAGSRNF